MSTTVAILGGLAVGGLLLTPRLARARATPPAPKLDGSNVSMPTDMVGAASTGLDLAAVSALFPEGEPRTRSGSRPDPVIDCPVSIGDYTSIQRRKVSECQAVQDVAAVVEQGRKCNRTPARLCSENPAYCARATATMAGAGLATVASAGLGWAGLVQPIGEFAARLALLPCEDSEDV